MKAKLDRAIKNDRIEPVHFIHWNGETLKRGTCTGLHAEHGHLLIKWEDERGGSQHYRLEGTIDPVHTAEYKKLCDAVLAAEKARDNFQKEHEFDLKAQIQEAVAANEKTAA